VQHRNIIDVIDLGVSEEGDPYLVMEYLEGEGLGSRLERAGPFDLPAASGILEAALVALNAAHDKGIVHRDLKPDNIFLVHQKGETPGVKLIDFGISKFVSCNDQTKLTQDGSMLGTPAYMSPEQARGLEEVDHRTDLYAVGVIMYEMLTGYLPFAGANYNELLVNVLTCDPADPKTVYPDFDEVARPVLEKALSKDPADRYQSAQEMLADVRGLSTVDERVKKLTLLGSDLDRSAHATGDLGKSQIEVGATKLASEIFHEMMDERGASVIASQKEPNLDSPKGRRIIGGIIRAVEPFWQKLAAHSWIQAGLWPFRHIGKKATKRPLASGVTGLLGAVIIVAFTVTICSGSGDESGVLITVKGTPKEAKIFYDDSLVPENPFKVERGETIVPLRVELPGRKEIKVSVIPSQDRVVTIKPQSSPRPSKSSKAKKAEVSAKQAPEKKSPKDKGTSAGKKEGERTSKKKRSSETKKSRRRQFNWPWRRRNK
jgi:hypothetical protein